MGADQHMTPIITRPTPTIWVTPTTLVGFPVSQLAALCVCPCVRWGQLVTAFNCWMESTLTSAAMSGMAMPVVGVDSSGSYPQTASQTTYLRFHRLD